MDFIEICIEEVALEGLDGITLPALWLRLENTRPTFPLTLDESCKQFLWGRLVSQSCLEFFKLAKPRPPFIPFDRFAHSDPETGIILEVAETPDCIYPIRIIEDKKKGIVGSCATYDTRKNITSSIRNANGTPVCSLKEAVEKYGQSLVIVASQERRHLALFGPSVDPGVVIPAKHFCVLERVGRSRYHGEITQGKWSLQVFKESAKSLFYIRKSLAKYDVLTAQVFNMKLLRGNNAVGKLVHLKRFYIQRKPVYLGWLETLTNRLSEKPNQMEQLTVIRSEMGLRETCFKKLYLFGYRYVKTEMIPYKQLFPASREEDFMIKNKTRERFVRVVKLIKAYRYHAPGEGDEEGEEEEEEEPDNDEEGPSGTSSEFTKVDLVREEPLLQQVYQYCCREGEHGVIQSQISSAFNVNKLESRLLCRNLERMGLVQKILADVGKQRVQVFVANDYVADSRLLKRMEAERNKIVNLKKEMAGWETTDSSPAGTPSASRSTTPVPTNRTTPEKSGNQEESEEEDADSSFALPFTDSVKTIVQHGKSKAPHVTYRLLRRASIVLEAVQEAKLIDNIYNVQKKIIEEEMAEGSKQRLDKKSLMRLIERLARDGQIKSIKTLIKFGDDEKELHFLCEAGISANDQIVKSAIEMAKLKYMALSKEVTREIISTSKKDSEVDLVSRDPNRPNYALLKSRLETEDMEYDPDAGRRYGYLPRMKRCHLVHELLWYLVYGYGQTSPKREGEEEHLVPSEVQNETLATDLKDLFEQVKGRNQNREEFSSAAAPSSVQPSPQPSTSSQDACSAAESSELVVYADEMTWKRFVPPLPKHTDYGKGWCLIGDVLMVMPLNVFCQIIRVNFKIRDLEEYLNDPEKRFIPVIKLPTLMRQQLMYARKFVFNFCEICTILCQIGLLSFGKREWKEKEQIFIYIHKKASVMDSTNINVSVEDRRVQTFVLDTYKDFSDFWFALQLICINTPPEIVYQSKADSRSAVKPSRFNDCLQGKSPDEITDEGLIPGNHLGAGGLDSSLWAHLRRNWTLNTNLDVKVETLLQKTKRKKPSAPSLTSGPAEKKKRSDENVATKPKKLTDVCVKVVEKAAVKKGGKGQKRKAPGPSSSGLSPPAPKQTTRQPRKWKKPKKKKVPTATLR